MSVSTQYPWKGSDHKQNIPGTLPLSRRPSLDLHHRSQSGSVFYSDCHFPEGSSRQWTPRMSTAVPCPPSRACAQNSNSSRWILQVKYDGHRPIPAVLMHQIYRAQGLDERLVRLWISPSLRRTYARHRRRQISEFPPNAHHHHHPLV